MINRNEVAKEKMQRAAEMLQDNNIDMWVFYARLKTDTALELMFNTDSKNEVVNLHKFLPFCNFCKVSESFLQFFAAQNSIPRNRFPYTELCRAWPFRTAESGICDSRAAI